MKTRYLTVDRLAAEIHPDRRALGRAAAAAVAAHLRDVVAVRGQARVMFACAPSQDEFLESLAEISRGGTSAVDWSRVAVFHMDEYAGLPADHAQSFRHYLREHLLSRVRAGRFHPIPAEAEDPSAACAGYAALLADGPLDLICLGIGENGHIAFNDPPVADFEDHERVKLVRLEEACRLQQVHDGCFAALAAVPTHALTVTVPVFRQARRLSVHVPGPRKAPAVRAALRGPIVPDCPASILRLHPDARLYLDAESAARLS
jgi:glucosamine-6-phosphate deaminase